MLRPPKRRLNSSSSCKTALSTMALKHVKMRRKHTFLKRVGVQNANPSTQCWVLHAPLNCVMCDVACQLSDQFVSLCSRVDGSIGASCCAVEDTTTSRMQSRSVLVMKISHKLFPFGSRRDFCTHPVQLWTPSSSKITDVPLQPNSPLDSRTNQSLVKTIWNRRTLQEYAG